MGHAIHWNVVLAEKIDKTAVMDSILRHADRDGDCGYNSRFTWHDEVSPLSSIEEAEAFIRDHDRGFMMTTL